MLIAFYIAKPPLAFSGTLYVDIDVVDGDYSAPTQVDNGEYLDVKVSIYYVPDTGDGSGPWDVVEVTLRDDDIWPMYNTIKSAPFESLGTITGYTWKYFNFYDVRLSDWDDGGDGIELYCHAEVEDPWVNPTADSDIWQVIVVDPDPTASRVTPSSPVTLEYGTNQGFTVRGEDAGDDLWKVEWTLSGPESESDTDDIGVVQVIRQISRTGEVTLLTRQVTIPLQLQCMMILATLIRSVGRST